MRQRLLNLGASLVPLAIAIAFVGAARGLLLAEETPEKPLSALIVFEHEGKTNALRIAGERPLAILENYFPNYRTQPASDDVGTWDARYEVYLNFAHGKTHRVLVSPNSRYWSMGRGDFELRGYFSDYVAAMLKAKNPRGRPSASDE